MGSVYGDGATQKIGLKILSSPANVASARRAVESFANACGFDEQGRGEIGLVVNEALANVIRHAYGNVHDRPIELSAAFAAGELVIAIRDWGSGCNPMELPQRQPDPLRPGGLGLVCMRQLMDRIEYLRQADGMLLRMVRRKDRRAHERADARSAC